MRLDTKFATTSLATSGVDMAYAWYIQQEDKNSFLSVHSLKKPNNKES